MCTVIKFCNVNQQNELLKINVLIQFFLSTTCFEHLLFIIRKTIMYMRPYMVCFSCMYASSLAGWRMCSIVFLMMNIRCSTYVDKTN